jgi:DNA mismatch repair protein MutS2
MLPPSFHPNPCDTIEAKSLTLLEWPTLFDALLEQCLSAYGRNAWESQPFLENAEAMALHQQEVLALQGLLQRFALPTLPHASHGLPVVDTCLKRLARSGGWSLGEAIDLLRVLLSARSLIGFVMNHLTYVLVDKTELEVVFLWLLGAFVPDNVLEALKQVLDAETGGLSESASPTWQTLRLRYKSQRKSLQEAADNLLRHPEYQSYWQNPSYTERDGRLVVPVKSTYKHAVPGLIRGSSSTGSTVFVEPQVLVVWHNRMAETEGELKTEEQRLLRELATLITPHLEAIEAYLEAFAQLDRRLAAAYLGLKLKANACKVLDSKPDQPQRFSFKQARHPLLMLSLPYGAVVPNEVTLGEKEPSGENVRTMVITGPNTGGKTVILKLVGLLGFMLRAGLTLPVAEGSYCSVFAPIFAELGDAQNLSQNLSTFSGHLLRLNEVFETEDKLPWRQGLILIDEIVAGTDPLEGSALARSLLQAFHALGALTLVTTHLGDLKTEAHQNAGYMNASSVFDVETLAPTYRLYLGVPGSSNALAIARRLGLPESLVGSATALMGRTALEAGHLLSELETNRRQAEDQRKEATVLKQTLSEQEKELKHKLEALQQSKQSVLDQYRAGLKRRFLDLEQQVKGLRKQVRAQSQLLEEQAALQLTNTQLHHMQGELDTAIQESQAQLEAENPIAKEETPVFEVGATVVSHSLNSRAKVIALQGKGKSVRYTIEAGAIKVMVKPEDLKLVASISTEAAVALKQAEAKQLKNKLRAMQGNYRATAGGGVTATNASKATFSFECDVRGLRSDEALEKVELFLDSALQRNVGLVSVIHGMGTGALKKAVRHYLSELPYVKRHYPEQAIYGGDGKTIIELTAG